jgi:hypothetical protein
MGEVSRAFIQLAKEHPGWIRFVPRKSSDVEALWALKKRGVVEIRPKDGLPAFRLVGDKTDSINPMIL